MTSIEPGPVRGLSAQLLFTKDRHGSLWDEGAWAPRTLWRGCVGLLLNTLVKGESLCTDTHSSPPVNHTITAPGNVASSSEFLISSLAKVTQFQ